MLTYYAKKEMQYSCIQTEDIIEEETYLNSSKKGEIFRNKLNKKMWETHMNKYSWYTEKYTWNKCKDKVYAWESSRTDRWGNSLPGFLLVFPTPPDYMY